METAAEPLMMKPVIDAHKLQPSMEEWIVSTVTERGMLTLDQLGLLLPATNWAQLFLAVDRLSRTGALSLRLSGTGEYLLSVTRQSLS